ncbi:hypothetical protein PUNSTDRAFT_139034 [Punctularia strigosozonata HHB-11173 SS5]|uniref:Extracellular mutant protein 11 C-terminal domain-containing protein n=1 Tax=Punctularia strigosozonata (strain HHB-11173) TaxID=741275 RepID=R7S2I2_PUNST|nr:uncharacterized protein PUNSTDRAFT_139034 [Punctularia strigosozonata HHB-11173 SS5]EIN03992.1 hypothetical protein PUNSTDRAFT_139034 [Punctularia strigosozonata HHB-11173 SS5]
MSNRSQFFPSRPPSVAGNRDAALAPDKKPMPPQRPASAAPTRGASADPQAMLHNIAPKPFNIAGLVKRMGPQTHHKAQQQGSRSRVSNSFPSLEQGGMAPPQIHSPRASSALVSNGLLGGLLDSPTMLPSPPSRHDIASGAPSDSFQQARPGPMRPPFSENDLQVNKAHTPGQETHTFVQATHISHSERSLAHAGLHSPIPGGGMRSTLALPSTDGLYALSSGQSSIGPAAHSHRGTHQEVSYARKRSHSQREGDDDDDELLYPDEPEHPGKRYRQDLPDEHRDYSMAHDGGAGAHHHGAVIEPPPTPDMSGSDLARILNIDIDVYIAQHLGAYEGNKRRWAEASPAEWAAGADELISDFSKLLDTVKDHMISKARLYAKLDRSISTHKDKLEARKKLLDTKHEELVRYGGGLNGV